jgi:hypothetical protein
MVDFSLAKGKARNSSLAKMLIAQAVKCGVFEGE